MGFELKVIQNFVHHVYFRISVIIELKKIALLFYIKIVFFSFLKISNILY